MQEGIVILLLAFRVFHQGMWGIFNISAWIHLWGWLTGSGPSGLDCDCAADGKAGMLGLAPWEVELHWRPSLGDSLLCICRPCYIGGRSIRSLDGLSFSQEESHTCGQCRFNTQLVFNVKPDLLLGFLFKWGRGPALLHPASGLLGTVCNFKSLIWRQSHLPGRLDLGGLGEGDEDCPWHSGEGLWHHLGLLLPLDQEHHFRDPDCPVEESSLGHLVASLACGSAEGDQVCKADWPWEHLLLLEGLVKLSAPCRPAIAICFFNSCHSSLMQSSCCWWESTLGASVQSPH